MKWPHRREPYAVTGGNVERWIQNDVFNWREGDVEWDDECVRFVPYEGAWEIYCELLEVEGEYAVIYVPPDSDEGHPWFNEPEGKYIVPEGLLYRQ